MKGQPLRFINGHNAVGPRTWTPTPGPLETPCWLWDGTITHEGYGVLRVNYRQIKAHRWVYEQMIGPLPEGLVIDHLCTVCACVNPAHLEPVTSVENVRRRRSLDMERADEIRRLRTTGMLHREIAAAVGTTKSQVNHVLNGDSWRPVSDSES